MFDPGRAFAIPSERVEKARPWLLPFLKAFERDVQTMSAEDVIRQAANADAQLWSYYDGTQYRGVIATRIHPMAKGSLCSIWACYGIDANELFEGMYQMIEEWAKAMGCYGIEIVGRPGFGRVLPGFRRTAVVLEKVFT